MSKEPNPLFDVPDVTCTVISQEGHCDHNCKVGKTFHIKHGVPPAGMCPHAVHTFFPFLQGLLFGASYPWEPDPDIARVACPDWENPVVYELRRLPKISKEGE